MTGGCGWEQCFSSPNLLRMIISFGPFLDLSGSALVCTMSLFAASETELFSDAASSISWGEFLQVNGIHIHGIRVAGGVWVGRKEREG